MQDVTWDQIVIAIVAIYGAVVSTYTLWLARQERSRHLKVIAFIGYVNNKPIREVAVMVTNPGFRNVAIVDGGLIMPDGKRVRIDPMPGEAAFFPIEISEGKNAIFSWPAHEIGKDFQRWGFSGAIQLQGYCVDGIGQVRKSRKFTYDMTEFQSQPN